MGLEEFIKQFDWSRFAFFSLFALPGFISLQVWSLIVPTDDRPLKEAIPEAVGFGVLNAVIGVPLLVAIGPTQPWGLYGLLIVSLIVLPALWPFALKRGLERLEAADLILRRARNGWDAAFLRREPLFVIVHLQDGRRITVIDLLPASIRRRGTCTLKCYGHWTKPVGLLNQFPIPAGLCFDRTTTIS
jgi:hypothetical protein